LQDNAVLADDYTQVSNAAAQPVLHLRFQMLRGSNDGFRDSIGVHETSRLATVEMNKATAKQRARQGHVAFCAPDVVLLRKGEVRGQNFGSPTHVLT